MDTGVGHYRPFWKLGVPVDVIESLSAFDGYRLIVAPMLFLLKPGVADRLKSFVESGGTLVLTYLSGVVNDTNLVFRGGLPGDGLRALAGIWPRRSTRSLPIDGNRWPPWAPIRSGSRASTPSATTASASTRRAPPCWRPTRPTSMPACPASP